MSIRGQAGAVSDGSVVGPCRVGSVGEKRLRGLASVVRSGLLSILVVTLAVMGLAGDASAFKYRDAKGKASQANWLAKQAMNWNNGAGPSMNGLDPFGPVGLGVLLALQNAIMQRMWDDQDHFSNDYFPVSYGAHWDLSLVSMGDLSFSPTWDSDLQYYESVDYATPCAGNNIAAGPTPDYPAMGHEIVDGWNLEPVKPLMVHDIQTNCYDVPSGPPNTYTFTSTYVRRYQYGATTFLAMGIEPQVVTVGVPTQNTSYVNCPYPTSGFANQYWSIDNSQTWLDAAGGYPVLHFADGTTIEFQQRGAFRTTTSALGGMLPTRKIDPNGNVTYYTYVTVGQDVLLQQITDARGRTLTFVRDPTDNVILSVTLSAGNSGTAQTWTLGWGTSPTFQADGVFPGYVCHMTSGPSCTLTAPGWGAVTSCHLYPALGGRRQLLSTTVPDGRSYQFSYGAWNQLTQVTMPDGATKTFLYGNGTDSNLATWQQARDALWMVPVSQLANYNKWGSPLPRRRMLVGEIDSAGANGPTLTKSYSYRNNAVGFWEDTTYVEPGIVHSVALFAGGNTSVASAQSGLYASLRGKPIAEETRAGAINGTLLEGTYWGDPTSTSLPYFTSENPEPAPVSGQRAITCSSGTGSNSSGCSWLAADVRATMVKHVRDGLTWWETFDYDSKGQTSIPANPRYRTWGNVVSHKTTSDASGSPGTTLAEAASQYVTGSYADFTPITPVLRNVGTTTVGNVTYSPSGRVSCNTYSLTSAAVLQSIHVYAACPEGPGTTVGAALYNADASGNPTTLITLPTMTRGNYGNPATPQWFNLPTGSFSLPAGNYALCAYPLALTYYGTNTGVAGTEKIMTGPDKAHGYTPFVVTSTGPNRWSIYLTVENDVPHGVNRLRLPSATQVKDGAGNILSSAVFAYDEYSLTQSGQAPSLDTTWTGTYRGNPTSYTAYTSAANATGPVSTHHYYLDNGAVEHVVDANGNTAMKLMSPYDFEACSSTKLTRTVTVADALGHTTTTVADCFHGEALTVTDANGQLSCSQYDGLGRLVETAAPGDYLSGQTQCTSTSSPASCWVRDTMSCTTLGSNIGDNGAGPTSWNEYFPFGIGGTTYNQARTIMHTRDGTSSGHYTKTFVDGFGRTLQTCSKVDPATNANNQEICSSSVYDSMGRLSQSYIPFYVAKGTTSVSATPSGDQYTQTQYDALGRVTSLQLMKNRSGVLPPTSTAYGASGANWLTTTTDANQCQVRQLTNALNQVVEKDVQNNALTGGVCPQSASWLPTKMNYDAAGRLLSVTDPSLNQTAFQYDGLGRKTQMVDPDMGAWKYEYDNNGNLTQQTDARGAVTHLKYDALNRITLRNLPYLKNGATWVDNVPGEQDEVTYYDSTQNLPSACYSCDDHCSTTTDTCNTATLTCNHTGKACANPDQ